MCVGVCKGVYVWGLFSIVAPSGQQPGLLLSRELPEIPVTEVPLAPSCGQVNEYCLINRPENQRRAFLGGMQRATDVLEDCPLNH